MCGLAGFYPKKGKKVNINKLYLLGIINEDRGTDSCGLSIGGTRITGTNLNKKARDFIASDYKDIEKIPMLNKPCIFHTRKSTLGAHNLDNCHPFVYTSADGINHFALAHNGMVSNIYDIKREFLKDVEDVDKMLHIDSHYLALSLGRALIGKADEKSILKYYKGSAALLYYNNDCFKAWKGANGDVEERPLYYIETPSGWYFGSIKDALYLVFDRLYEVKEVKNNELLTFHKHTLEKSEIIVREHKEEKTIYYGGVGGWDYTYEKRHLPVTSPSRSGETVIKNITTNKPFFDSPVAHPRLNIFHCKYTDMNNGKPIEGEFKCVNNPNTTPKEMYTLFSKKSSMENKVTFVDGVLVNDKYIFNAIRSRFFNKGISVDKFFHAEKNRLANTVIDFMPLFRNKELYAVIYRKSDKTLDYITKYDNVHVSIRPLFGPLPVTFIADGSTLSLTNNQTYD